MLHAENAGLKDETGVLTTISMYSRLGNEAALKFWQDCGYNTLELWEMTFTSARDRIGDLLKKYHDDIEQARRLGFKVNVLTIGNTARLDGKTPQDPAKWCFSPKFEADRLSERLEDFRGLVRALKNADGFIVFAGDPGGDPSGRSSWQDFGDLVVEMHKVMNNECPGKELFVNTWSISSWGKKWLSPHKVEFWEQERELQDAFYENLPAGDISMELPIHCHYRNLARKLYLDAGKQPPDFPSAATVQGLRRKGVKHVRTWPYFLIDIVNAGERHQSFKTVQAEVRYIKQVIEKSVEIGADGVVGNCADFADITFDVGYSILNEYAFARLARSPDLPAEEVIREFSGLIVEHDSVPRFAEILFFMENNSPWHRETPEQFKLPAIKTGIRNNNHALEELKKVRPLAKPRMRLPIATAGYLEMIRKDFERREDRIMRQETK